MRHLPLNPRSACGSKLHRNGFTLIELLVVISIIATAMALLLPAISTVMSTAKSVKCSSNQRQIFMSFQAYADDNRDVMPTSQITTGNGNDTFWFALVAPYLDSNKTGGDGSGNAGFKEVRKASVVWGCPSYRRRDADHLCGYGMNVWLRSPNGSNTTVQNATWSNPLYEAMTFSSITHTGSRPLFGDSVEWIFYPKWSPPSSLTDGSKLPRHRDRIGVAYVDGHVAMVTQQLAADQAYNPAQH